MMDWLLKFYNMGKKIHPQFSYTDRFICLLLFFLEIVTSLVALNNIDFYSDSSNVQGSKMSSTRVKPKCQQSPLPLDSPKREEPRHFISETSKVSHIPQDVFFHPQSQEYSIVLYLRLCLSYPLTITPVITLVSSEEIKGIFQSQNIKLDHISKSPLHVN